MKPEIRIFIQKLENKEIKPIKTIYSGHFTVHTILCYQGPLKNVYMPIKKELSKCSSKVLVYTTSDTRDISQNHGNIEL